MVDITPAIFSEDLAAIKSAVEKLAGSVPWIQLDLSDGTMVPAKTFFQLDQLTPLISSDPSLSFEAHLMVDNPVKYLKLLADAGFKRIIAQVEASDPRRFLEEAQHESVDVGLALDGVSELVIIEPFFDVIDLVVVMTIEAGAVGSPFLPESLEKIRSLRHHYPDLTIAAEGNIDEVSAKLAVEAGATRLIISSDLFLKNPSRIAQNLRTLAGR